MLYAFFFNTFFEWVASSPKTGKFPTLLLEKHNSMDWVYYSRVPIDRIFIWFISWKCTLCQASMFIFVKGRASSSCQLIKEQGLTSVFMLMLWSVFGLIYNAYYQKLWTSVYFFASRRCTPSHAIVVTYALLLSGAWQSAGNSSALFLTGAAQNLLCLKLAEELGVVIVSPWVSWFVAASLPAIVSLLATPFVLYKLYPPETKDTPDAPAHAARKLELMGPITRNEWAMVGTMLLAVSLWVFG